MGLWLRREAPRKEWCARRDVLIVGSQNAYFGAFSGPFDEHTIVENF